MPPLNIPWVTVYPGKDGVTMGIEQEISEIIHEHEAEEMASQLIERIRKLPLPSPEDKESLVRILEDVSRELPCSGALWMAFWLGCGYQSIRGRKEL
jgi:hypothetical protein